MNNDKRTRKHLSTVHTARLLANIIIFSGFLLLILVTLFNVLSPLAVSGEIENETLSIIQLAYPYFSDPSLFGYAAILFWSGYVLKLLSVLVETQVIEI